MKILLPQKMLQSCFFLIVLTAYYVRGATPSVRWSKFVNNNHVDNSCYENTAKILDTMKYTKHSYALVIHGKDPDDIWEKYMQLGRGPRSNKYWFRWYEKAWNFHVVTLSLVVRDVTDSSEENEPEWMYTCTYNDLDSDEQRYIDGEGVSTPIACTPAIEFLDDALWTGEDDDPKYAKARFLLIPQEVYIRFNSRWSSHWNHLDEFIESKSWWSLSNLWDWFTRPEVDAYDYESFDSFEELKEALEEKANDPDYTKNAGTYSTIERTYESCQGCHDEECNTVTKVATAACTFLFLGVMAYFWSDVLEFLGLEPDSEFEDTDHDASGESYGYDDTDYDTEADW